MDILKYIVSDYREEDLMCFVLEKNKPYKSGSRIKNGFHLHFPFFFMSSMDQEMHILPRVLRRVDEEKVFEDIGYEKSSEVIDKGCSKKQWLLYGSRKDTSLEAYKLTKILNQ